MTINEKTSDIMHENSMHAAGNQTFCLTCCHNTETHYSLMLFDRFV